MKYTEPHKTQMLETLGSLIAINQREIDSHMAIVELLTQENDETIKRIESIRNDGTCDGSMCKRKSGDECGDTFDGWVCTLDRGHAGKHSACAPPRHNIHEWRNTNETNPTNDTTDIYG